MGTVARFYLTDEKIIKKVIEKHWKEYFNVDSDLFLKDFEFSIEIPKDINYFHKHSFRYQSSFTDIFGKALDDI